MRPGSEAAAQLTMIMTALSELHGQKEKLHPPFQVVHQDLCQSLSQELLGSEGQRRGRGGHVTTWTGTGPGPVVARQPYSGLSQCIPPEAPEIDQYCKSSRPGPARLPLAGWAWRSTDIRIRHSSRPWAAGLGA